MATIFSRIISGELPSHKVYEDEFAYAFMDIHPLTPGQVVVATKTDHANFEDMSDEDFAHLTAAAKKIARKIKEVFNSKKVGLFIEGIDTPDHVHIVLLPIDDGKDVRSLPNPSDEVDHDALEEVANKLRIE